MFRPTTPDAYKQISRDLIGSKFKWVDGKLAGKQYLMGDTFTAPDAYLYVMTRWAKRMEMDLGPVAEPQGVQRTRRSAPEGAGSAEGGRVAAVRVRM